MSDKSRKVLDIVEIVGYEGGGYKLNPLFSFVREKEELENGKIVGHLKRTANPMVATGKFEMSGVKMQLK